jgi:hypothetical protein
MPQWPIWHVAVPFAAAGQTSPQLPQFCVSIESSRHWLPHGM